MHKSRRVDSDLTLLERLKIGSPNARDVGRFPIVKYYINSVFAYWGWKENHTLHAVRYLQSSDSSADLSSLDGKGNSGSKFMNRLFWSIAVVISGILTYAIITSPVAPPSTLP